MSDEHLMGKEVGMRQVAVHDVVGNSNQMHE